MDYRVVLAAQADRDLEQIVHFLARKNPAAAERLGYAYRFSHRRFLEGAALERAIEEGCEKIDARDW